MRAAGERDSGSGAGYPPGVTLRTFMETHAGDYTLAEGLATVSVDQLDPDLAAQPVDVYEVGLTPDGRSKVHLYVVNPHRHVLTYVASAAGSPPGPDARDAGEGEGAPRG
ncbi:MAG TPA: hypothetical protein VFB58_07490 [Chloroflexota bacterium]|nr:hypothetical protein [Chloroflexota bacterium]